MRLLVCLFLLIATSGTAHADVDIRVGAGSACFTSSIQTAINNAVPANGITNILIARNTPHVAQQLDINGRNVRLIGGYADCNQAVPDATKTLLSGAGGSANTVVAVRGSSSVVAFYNLEITGGDEVTSSSGRGGGFSISGGPHALVFFDNMYIHDNQAGYGGGVYIDNQQSSNNDDVYVYMGSNVRIDSNYGAYAGGGLWCSDAKLVFVGTNSYIARNYTARNVGAIAINGPGGGIRAENCSLWMGASTTLGSLFQNTAGGNGGGLSIAGGRARAIFYTRNAARPPAVLSNIAGGTGGAIQVDSSAQVTGYDLILADNIARDGGAAIAVYDNDDPPDAGVLMRGTLQDAPSDPNSPEGVAVLCTSALLCNRISGNLAMTESGGAQEGAAVRVSADSGFTDRANPYVDLYGTRITGNSGDSLVRLVSDTVGLAGANVALNGTLVVDNTVNGTLLENPSDNFNGLDGNLLVKASTIAGNTIGSGNVIRSNDSIFLRTSIIWQPDDRVLQLLSGSLSSTNVDYVLASDLLGIPSSTHNLVADPLFQNAGTAGYQLKLASPALDYAAPDSASASADHLPRVVDLAGIQNEYGEQDLGAFERQFICAADTVFCHGFE